MTKEFVAVTASDSLEDNYSRILKDTSEATQLNYHKRFAGWGLKTPEDILQFIEQLNEKWLQGDYRYATVRQYKAAIGYALSNAYQFKVDPSKLSFKFKEYYVLSQNSTKEQLELLYKDYLAIGTDGDKSKLDKKALHNEQTSSTKDKRFPEKLASRIAELKKPSSVGLLQKFIALNIKLGLRPIEYREATLVRHDIAHNEEFLKLLGFSNTSNHNALNLVSKPVDDTKPLLLVKNAKNSHSRACGDYRLLYLDVLSHEEIDLLKEMMLQMKQINENSDLGFRKAITEPLRRQLHHIVTTDPQCVKIIKNLHDEKMRSYRKQVKKGENRNKPVFKKPTPYSTRHQAVANAKAQGLHPIEIAACFGHSSVFTAESHYGKRVFGSGSNSLTPSQASVNEVVARLGDLDVSSRLENREMPVDSDNKLTTNTQPKTTQKPKATTKPSRVPKLPKIRGK